MKSGGTRSRNPALADGSARPVDRRLTAVRDHQGSGRDPLAAFRPLIAIDLIRRSEIVVKSETGRGARGIQEASSRKSGK